MRTIRLPRARRSRSATLAALVSVLAVAVGTLGAGTASAVYLPVTTTIHPGADVLAAMRALRPGDTLLLAAGTYNTGYLRADRMAVGSAAFPITVAAADPTHPPLLVGGLRFYSPSYLVLRSLRVQAANIGTDVGLSALVIDGGTGWSVISSEFFGARQTNSMANVNISGTGGYPRAWTFTQNCVHDAANSTRADATDHNLYLSYAGSAATTGVVSRNIVWGAPHGENIKLGNGGLAGAIGPWGVRVVNNTLALGGRQLLLHADVSNNVVAGNIFYHATQGFVSNPKTTQVYVHDVVGTGNSVAGNYSSLATMVSYDPTNKVSYGGGNVVGADPGFTGVGSCGGWKPTLAAAAAYGRWASPSGLVPMPPPVDAPPRHW